YASEIPSAQRRGPPSSRPLHHTRTPSGKHPLDPKLSGMGVGRVPIQAPHIPARSSKVSEKLVLLPETTEEHGLDADGFDSDDERAPPSDELLEQRRKQVGLGGDGKSYAERLPKARRTEKLARVTAYCTAQSYRLRATAAFVRDQHGARTKLYDDALYCVYQLPLLGGNEGYRVRSSPVLKSPGGKNVLDEQIEANERREYREGWLEDRDSYSVRGESPRDERDNPMGTRSAGDNDAHGDDDQHRRESDSSNLDFPSSPTPVAPDAMSFAELLIFSYGVAVFWNFTPHQEKDILADLTFSSTSALSITALTSSKSSLPNPLPLPLLTRPLPEADFETEEFHFEYKPNIPRPRVFNDMITLRSGDHMIKLAMSHAIAQSTKLSFFEERMSKTMSEAQYVPRRLALEGRLGMTREEVVRVMGRLFQERVDVNLCTSIPTSLLSRKFPTHHV
ncbi:Sad1-interacting factor 3, partial [Elasticomyces elasticus]